MHVGGSGHDRGGFRRRVLSACTVCRGCPGIPWPTEFRPTARAMSSLCVYRGRWPQYYWLFDEVSWLGLVELA